MSEHVRRRLASRLDLFFILFCLLFAAVWLAGGASRADALGQVVVRFAAWAAIVAIVMMGRWSSWREARFPTLFLLAVCLLVAAQLVPLPPAIWQSLPGRELLRQSPAAVGDPGLWHPWTLVPSATINAAGSLVVPLAFLAVLIQLDERQLARAVDVLLIAVILSTLLGLLQFSGAVLVLPFVNDTLGDVNGGFANRNHFALFLAIGCVTLPAWAFSPRRRAGWRLLVALGLLPLLILTILATGSRTGMLLGAIALLMGGLIALDGIRRALRRAPRWVAPVALISAVLVIAGFVALSVVADRAASIQRVIDLDAGQDMRARAMPTILSMITSYFPAGSGFGGFESLFRQHEPFALLKPTYFNHAHNDLLEIVLDGGVGATILLLVAVAWWIHASIRAWRHRGTPARLGSAIVALTLVASAFDYPARTPLIMSVLVIAAVLLSRSSSEPAPVGSEGAHYRSDRRQG